MKIHHVEIHDIYGIKDASFEAGTVTVISGGNGTGKSSILRALLAIFEGGHSPEIRRRMDGDGRPFVEKGWARITLDTGTTVTMTVSEKRTNYEIQAENGLAIPQTPRQFIEILGSSMAVDPSKILAADVTTAAGKKVLLAEILKTMPIHFAAEELPELCRQPDGIDLDQFEKARKSIEETRRRIGVEARDGEGTLKELAKSLPETAEETDWAAERDRLESERRSIEKAESDQIAGIARDSTVLREAVSGESSKAEVALREEFQAQLDAIKEGTRAKLDEIAKLKQAAIGEARLDSKPQRELVVTALAEAKEKAAQQERAAGAKETIEKMRLKVREKSLDYERFTRTLEAMDRAKRAKLEALPVHGLEFNGDSVLVDGVEWQNVNKARLGSVAYQISALRAGELPFLILDDTEHMDRESWAGVLSAAVEGGFQVIAARVSEDGGPLRIETGRQVESGVRQ